MTPPSTQNGLQNLEVKLFPDSTIEDENDGAILSQLVSQASGYKCADPKTGLKV